MFHNLNFRRTFLAATLFALLTSVAGAALNDRVVARIPFAFDFAGVSLPAGEYSFEEIGNGGVITVTSMQTRLIVTSMARSLGGATPRESGTLGFTRKDGKITLHRVSMPSGLSLEPRSQMAVQLVP